MAACPWALSAQERFQQQVDHVITVRLDDQRHELHGSATFTYTNHAPEALDTLWIHLWPNAYQRGSALCRQLDNMGQFDLHFAPDSLLGGIDSLAFRLETNGTSSDLVWGTHPRHADIGWVALPEQLPTDEAVTISTPFRVRIPDGRFSRLGHTGQAYYVTQWYPKPAVYDEQGWHAMPYLTLGEFFSEFGSYDVSIDVPANYVVGATGVPVPGQDDETFMAEMAASPLPGQRSNAFPPSASDRKVLRFRQDRVHDFAWFADKRFLVRRDSVTLDNGHRVMTQVLFTPRNAGLWDSATTYVNESLLRYSRWVGPYPYDRCTAVDGTISAGGGMEYPMITIIGNMGGAEELDNVIAHEVGHNWFQGMLASNERDHPWMDEGMNSFVELRYMRERHPDGGLEIGLPGIGEQLRRRGDRHRLQNELMYRFNARRNLDQAIGLPSEAFTPINYGAIVYGKTALVFDHLYAYLGEAVFDRCMHAYFEGWKFRHPRPDDVRTVFERESGMDLGWAFEGLIGTDTKVDARARRLEGSTFEHVVTGGVAAPFPVGPASGTEDPAVWTDPVSEGRTGLPEGWSDGRLDATGRTLDIDRRNNTVKAQGLFRRWTKPELRFGTGLEKDDRRSFYWLPALAYNAHDGFMAGLAVHDLQFPSRRFEWAVAPLYGFQSERLVGGAKFLWHADRMRSNWLRNLHVGLGMNSASLKAEDDLDRWYMRFVPQLQLDLRGPEGGLVDHTVRARSVVLQQHVEGTTEGTSIDVLTEDIFHELRWNMTRTAGLQPFDVSLSALQHPAFTRLELDARQSFLYDRKKHRVSLRLFAGQFLRKEDELMRREFGWRLHWGSADLLYDHLFVDRQDVGTLTAQQVATYQGGFRTPNSLGTSDSWLLALNLEADAPFALPLSFFGSLGTSPVTRVTAEGRQEEVRSYWEVGLGLRIIRDALVVWMPLATSQDITDQLEFNNFDFLERVRFTIALEKLDPTTALRRAPH